MDTVQGILSFGMSMSQAPTQLENELDQLKTKLLISRSEWGMVEAHLLQHKYTTYDAEDLHREFEDQALRHKIEDASRSRAASAGHACQQRMNSSPRDTERDQVMEMLGVTLTIDRAAEINQVISQMGMPLTMGSTSAGSKGKGTEAASHDAIASTSKAKRLNFDSNSSAGLAETANCGNVSVLPIFGIGGMGKTTLAQLIDSDEREIIIQPNFDLSCGLGVLEADLWHMLKIQKFLLSFYAPLKNGLEGSMILVTTRHKNIAQNVTAWSKCSCKPLQLEGLPAGVFWEFFKKCAFGKECPESYPRLQEIGQSISSKLHGTPLAAKTLGRLLNSNLTEQHWRTIKDSELWEQEQKHSDILPALRLSYLYLPTELRRCFAFCSIFPKDYSFKRHEIVDIWVAEGFVSPQVSKRLEDVGMKYLDDLRGRCLFQTDPKFPNQDKYVMHDLIHDTAQYVSIHECFSMKDLSGMTNKPRHMSIEVDGTFGTELDVEITWFSQLSNILFLSLKGCKLKSLPQSICGLNSLRYLDISYSNINEVPSKFWCLNSLQVVVAFGSCLRTIRQDVTKLINLRQLALPEQAAEARLVDKKYLKEIELNWRTNPRVFEPTPRENEVIDGLCPHERIECPWLLG
ncbi:hypothetical protein SETIT_6G072000v2 [Setaria italica]|uniref:NB-ARC domain-containing protein n=1 Tax=Setaria italica TaxID=4555 RepID=A0A368RIX9_SETIT|nr:hypothetical protein SETIT_6G072000v2 [Setaria italica]